MNIRSGTELDTDRYTTYVKRPYGIDVALLKRNDKIITVIEGTNRSNPNCR